ncbi:MAG: TrkA C-terminal domain-containing protein [Bacteroidota bacterium]
MILLFKENPLLLLFIVIAVGYIVGTVRIRGTSLGVAAVLFVGLGFGGLDRDLQIPDIVFLLGLSIFVYTIGLNNGPAFFKNFRRSGFRDISFILFMLTISAAITVGIHFLFGFEASTTAGLFAGSTTNTPALAGLLDTIGKGNWGALTNGMIQRSVVGYSLSYPMGVLGAMIAIAIMQRLLRVDFRQEELDLSKDYPLGEGLVTVSVEVKNEAVLGRSIRGLLKQYDWRVVFGRLQRGEEMQLINWDTRLEVGDRISAVGSREAVESVVLVMGDLLPFQLSDDRREYDISRIFVSNPKIAGQSLASLNLAERFSAIVTRVRRGDVDLLANGRTILELGDRVRFVAQRKDQRGLAELFGDSYEALSRINLFSFGFGMALGLLVGMVTLTLPGGIAFNLGFAGGPLIIGLMLGSLRRSGPIVWTLPYGAARTLQQFGLMLLLACIGIRSGHTFFNTITQGGAGMIFLAGSLISTGTALITLWVGYRWIKIPFSFLMGMVSSQPAILQYAVERSGNRLPDVGYTLMFPIALIIKIVYVQILFAILN